MSNKKVIIVDYNSGNIGSVINMFKYIGVDAELTNDPDEIRNAERLILPGVGNFSYGMKQLEDSGLIPILNDVVLNKKTPILGICLGAQLMTLKSEEGMVNGLGWLDAVVEKFKFSSEENIKLPNIGWRDISIEKESILFNNMYANPRFYFVHSYRMNSNNTKDVLAKSSYNIDFTAALEKENIYALQFHPEKSHKYGLEVFKNFVNIQNKFK